MTQAAEAVAGRLSSTRSTNAWASTPRGDRGHAALLTRINSRTGELRTEAQVDFFEELCQPAAVPGPEQLGHLARNREAVLPRVEEEREIGSLMHAPIELGPRLYGVLSVAHEERGRFETTTSGGWSSWLALGGRDSQRDRLPARTSHSVR